MRNYTSAGRACKTCGTNLVGVHYWAHSCDMVRIMRRGCEPDAAVTFCPLPFPNTKELPVRVVKRSRIQENGDLYPFLDKDSLLDVAQA